MPLVPPASFQGWLASHLKHRLPVNLSPVSHGENQDEKDVVADFVEHAIVTHTDSERVETRKLYRPGGARVGRKRENPRLEAPLNRGG